MTPYDQLDITKLRILDGGMATELERHGCNISGPLWSAHVFADSPWTIEDVHLNYLEAGADCILTASYQVSAMGYAELGQPPEAAADALRQSVDLAVTARERYRKVSSRPVWIGVSLGPYGAVLHNGSEYHGNYDVSFADLVRFHAERLAVIETTEADFVALESVPSLEEAEAIVEALHQHPDVHGWASFTCKDEEHVSHGEQLARCAEFLDKQKQIIAVGVNCTQPRLILPLIGELKRATRKPLVVYPNSGEGWDAEHHCWTGASDAGDFGRLAREWAEAGAQIIGGCCRTRPGHIRAIRESLSEIPAAH
ncbi:homocysteine S-methyltransferase [Alloacidobacterium sp.]|uniref:homocysteine S-methyltransferase n=1 Tax=Alloacidobacterium sp. TaxID=2951999 RepID=UPI002D2FF497|nr:homocysteine S-methyltransferase [Alloacidobacterium sp.]HYK37171.1 homocysteine S-methyltransferase [Alloacidobacterium sp.]